MKNLFIFATKLKGCDPDQMSGFLLTMLLKEQIERLVEEKFEGSDYFLVEVKESPAKIAVFIDHPAGIKIDDCIELTKFLQSQLGEIVESRELEVSSPGMEEPLKVLKQYQKRIGNEVTVLMKDGIRKNGVLKAVVDDGIEISQKSETVHIPFDKIKETKIVFSFDKIV